MKQYIVDAFADQLFHGNQAAVNVMNHWPSDQLMQSIAGENNYSETAFTVKNGDHYDLRWFTPGGEIDLCGHATLGTAYVLFEFYETAVRSLRFHTKGGELEVKRDGSNYQMDFPAYKVKSVPVTPTMTKAFGAQPQAAYLDRDLLAVFDDEQIVRQMKPNLKLMKELPGLCIGVTAPGKDYDCVSRVFAPRLDVAEDPVTGSTHCMITPYWAGRLGRNQINAYQASSRGGKLKCILQDGRVLISGPVTLYEVGDLKIDG